VRNPFIMFCRVTRVAFSRVYAEVAKKLLEKGSLRAEDVAELEELYGDDARDAIDALIAAGAARRVGSRIEAADADRLKRIARMRA
jgi:hypothetical protein